MLVMFVLVNIDASVPQKLLGIEFNVEVHFKQAGMHYLQTTYYEQILEFCAEEQDWSISSKSDFEH